LFINSYLQAGADVIATATYQASIMGFMKHLSVDSSKAEQLIREAVALCQTARDNFWQDTANHAGTTLSFTWITARGFVDLTFWELLQVMSCC